MREGKAFSPCHITGLFQIFGQSTDPLYVGSRGAGVSLTRGVETVVKIEKSRNPELKVKINGVSSNSAEVSERVVDFFFSGFQEVEDFEVEVEYYVDLPIGAGFGTSGSAALSLALALNYVFGQDRSEIEAGQLAHIAEVRCKTGLGTVMAETSGGLEIRVKPGAPGIGEIKHIPVFEGCRVACLYFGPLSTKKFLADEGACRRINECGGELVDRLIEDPTLPNFLRFSRQFAEKVGLITERVREVLEATDSANFLCSMPIFGESVFTLIDKESLPQVLKIFRNYTSQGRIIVSKIDLTGARLIKND